MNLNRFTLAVLRDRSGMSKATLARRAGVDRTLIHRIENGERNATPDVIRKLATALDCPVLALVALPAELGDFGIDIDGEVA